MKRFPAPLLFALLAALVFATGCHDDNSPTSPPLRDAMNWLFKEEPTHYSFDDFVRDKRTAWSGVKNPLAQKHLRLVKKGDRIFYYHTGDEKSVVGIAKALTDSYPDPKDKS